jgi:PBP1b-binding outer membrane lipoprotein LpoB
MIEAESVIGVFIGLEAASYEYVADIIAPYQLDFSIDIGSFLLIEGTSELLVARVMQYVPRGEFTSFMGEKWLSDVALEGDVIGPDIKKRKISYRVRIKILGALTQNGDFKPGLLRIPHITSRVCKPNVSQVEQIVNKALKEQERGIEVGTYALDDSIRVKFDMNELNAKRTFIFARAGYGKSNLMKVIASKWNPKYGGLLIFDPEGEYATTDAKQRPGIMDKREAILITNRNLDQKLPNVYTTLKLNLKDFNPRTILPTLVAESKHDNIFFMKLMGLEPENWCRLVDLLIQDGFASDDTEIIEILGLDKNDSQAIGPIKNNLVPAIRDLHDPDSKLMNIVEEALKQGRVLIIDVSLIDSKNALRLSSIIVNHIFNINVREFTSAGGAGLITATFVVEEAQSVLSGSDVGPFVELAKEGRKYHLGGIFVTQQPGSIPPEIVSQGDNFFVFHLLSRGDLQSLQKANAHYSDDIITQILNEPTKGKCYMWTSHQPFVIPVCVNFFEDPSYAKKNQSTEIQSKSNILGPILKNISDEFENPLFSSILKKFEAVENENIGEEIGKKTVALFRKLSDAEKAFLRERKRLQKNRNQEEFAVTTHYYQELIRQRVSLGCRSE